MHEVRVLLVKTDSGSPGTSSIRLIYNTPLTCVCTSRLDLVLPSPPDTSARLGRVLLVGLPERPPVTWPNTCYLGSSSIQFPFCYYHSLHAALSLSSHNDDHGHHTSLIRVRSHFLQRIPVITSGDSLSLMRVDDACPAQRQLQQA